MSGDSPYRPAEALFPMPAERQRLDNLLTQQLLDANRRIAAGAVTPRLDLEVFRQELAGFNFMAPLPVEETLTWAIAQLERGVTHMTHPRYFGLFNPAPTIPSQHADRITATLNPQLATATTSPAGVAIEAHTIRAVAQRAGFPADATGHFTTGGAEANYTALICALTRAHPLFGADGVRAFIGAPVFYISRESHLAWLKIAHQAGIGRNAVRLVATDGSGRMDMAALAALIDADRRDGRIPVMLVATAGTTNAGMIDPLRRSAEIARDHGLWYHIDAAWGGGLVASDALRPRLDGIDTGDSVTIDAHKWFATTMGCGMFITRDPAILSSVFQVSTGYMPSNTASVDPYVTSLQWSRRFLGLRLFLSLAAAGWPGYAQHVERAVALIVRLKERLSAKGWRIANDGALAVLCIEPPNGGPPARAIVQRVLASGQAWISVAAFEGRDIIRACITHGETTPADCDALVDALEAAARHS
ncbi:MAG TPA: pyridoxal-dependent decarboxylase [Stellaceae bacterium]|jgi:glutamate/tyrosine decarboxylase-like PLP-dependent enzyme|nr:pyridoxal-dependent decarboxylase [Stellaceae bacterium]